MGTVQVFTAARMQQIEDTTVVSGLVDVNGNLILRQRNNVLIDAGNLRGPAGNNGTNGTNGVDGGNMIPGMIMLWFSGVVPTNALALEGQTIVGGVTSFPALAAVYPAWVSGNNLILPDSRGRVMVGRDLGDVQFDVLGETGGAKTHTLTAAEGPPHTHGLNYGGTALAGGLAGGNAAGGMVNWYLGNSAFTADPANRVTVGTTAAAAAHNNLQPYLVTRYIVWTASSMGNFDPIVQQALVASVTELQNQSIAPRGRISLPFTATTRPWDVNSWGPLDADVEVPMWLFRNTSGIVTITGFALTVNSIANNAVIATLPLGYRPATLQTFKANVQGVSQLITIHPNGTVTNIGGLIPAENRISFAGIAFFEVSQQPAITAATLLSPFTATTSHGVVGHCVDSFGDVWLSGRVDHAAARAENTPIFLLPVAARGTSEHHFESAASAPGGYAFAGLGTTGQVWGKGIVSGGGFVCLNGIVIQPTALDASLGQAGASNISRMGSIPISNSWQNYAAGFTTPSFRRRTDGLVTLRGFVSVGTMNTNVFRLPARHRPFQTLLLQRVSFAGSSEVVIDTDGFVRIQSGSNTWFSLDGIVFQSYR